MLFNLYAMYDKAGEQYGNIFQCVNDAIAVRNGRNFLMKIEEYDRDAFQLFIIGTFDDVSGEVEGFVPKEISIDIPKFDHVKARKVVPEVDNA